MKNLLLITMLLGVGYSWECEEFNAAYGTNYNCDCNEDTWQEFYNSEGHNMEGCWLVEADLSGAYLYMAILSFANLEGANLTEANLIGAYLSGADLFLANLYGAELAYANLSWANLFGADLFLANLYGANLCNLAGSPGGECEQPDVTDENDDGYDDVSYEVGYIDGAESGDLNLDGTDNIQDLVILVGNILNN